MAKERYYYQIDYIDEGGEANYIDVFTSRQRNKAIEHVNILNEANRCLNADTYFVLDKYVTESDELDELDEIVEENITNAESINMHLAKLKENLT